MGKAKDTHELSEPNLRELVSKHLSKVGNYVENTETGAYVERMDWCKPEKYMAMDEHGFDVALATIEEVFNYLGF